MRIAILFRHEQDRWHRGGLQSVPWRLGSADVIARPAPGIDPGVAGFAEMLDAIRAGAAYANVHTTLFQSGEIRGLLVSHGPGGE